MDVAIQELPKILDTKVDIDSGIQKINIQVGKINNLRRSILDQFELIQNEQLKEKEIEENGLEEDKTPKQTQESSVSLIYSMALFILVI